MKNPICWWFGCDPDYGHSCELDPSYVVPCKRCGAPDTSMEDRVGETKHSRFVCLFAYWLWRKWVSAKCSDCGRRYGNHEQCDELPF